MATYALTVSTNDLGLGVIEGARVVVERKRTLVTDIFNGQSIGTNNTATNSSGIATILLEPDDGSVYHELKIFDLVGILVYSKIFTMPPQAVEVTALPVQDIISSSAAQAVAASVTATEQAVIATDQADIATAQADIATAQAVSLAESGGSALVGNIRTGSFAVARTVRDVLGDTVSVKATTGVTGNSGTDQGAAINNAIVDAASRGKCDLYFPDGNYDTTVPIIQLPGVTLRFAKNAELRAVASMASLLTTDPSQPVFDVGIYGSRLNCNDLASVGHDVQWFQHYKSHDVLIENFLTVGARFGLIGTAYSSYEAMIHGLKTMRAAGTVAANSIALHLNSATDCKVHHSILIGGETGLKLSNGGHFIEQTHAWVRATTGLMKTGFDIQAGTNTFIGCFADTPTVAGFNIAFGNNVVSGCRAYMNPASGNDNISNGIYVQSAAPNLTVANFMCVGGDASHRFKSDIDFSSVTSAAYLQLIGNIATNCVATAPSIMLAKSPLEFDGEASAQIGMRIKLAGKRRWDFKTNTSGDLVLSRCDATGAVLDTPLSISLAFGSLTMNTDSVNIAGTWDKPINFGTNRLWVEVATGKLRIKASEPAFDADGTVVGTQT